jgi:hypothetical protein
MKDGEDRWKRAVKYSKIALSILPEGPTSLVVESIGDSPAQKGSGWPDKDTCRRIVNAINEAWISASRGRLNPIKALGRYAPALISRGFQVSAKAR